MDHQIERAERKLSVLNLAKSYTPKKVASILGIEEKEVNGLIKEALRDIEERNEELGQAVMYLELERIEEVKRLMMRFINKFESLVELEEGNITDQSEKAFDMVMKSADRLDKFLTRTSKLLGLDAPVKLQAQTGSDAAPEAVLNAAMSIHDNTALPPASDSTPEEFKIEDL